MNETNVLVVGAGAMGLVTGYHLQLGGAKITFLVRPGTCDRTAAPALLYSYDDGNIKRFEGYEVEDDIAKLRTIPFDFAIVTIDYAQSLAATGTQLLRDLGEALADGDTTLIIGGVGIGLREHYIRATGLPPHRILNGVLGALSHQTSANLPVHSPTKSDLLEQARVAYRHPQECGFVLDSMYPEPAAAFAEVYGRNGTSCCLVIDEAQFAVMTNAPFCALAAKEIMGWPPACDLVSDEELWPLSCSAQREIASLPQFGMDAATVAQTMTNEMLAKIQIETEIACHPLDYPAFNRFHHGSKVSAQDILVLQNCLKAGAAASIPMPALTELVARLEERRKPQRDVSNRP